MAWGFRHSEGDSMRIKMIAQLSGFRDGAEWPVVGGELEVPDAEGALLCANGQASPVAVAPKVERAVAPAAEKRARKS